MLTAAHADYSARVNLTAIATQPKAPRRSHLPAPAPAVTPLLDRIAAGLEKGPTSLLHRCFVGKRRVAVMLRRKASVLGVCVGTLRGFDRHLNLVLADVDEVTGGPGGGGGGGGAVDGARRRHLPLVLVRGDNVVMCWEPQAEGSEGEGTSKARAAAAGGRAAAAAAAVR